MMLDAGAIDVNVPLEAHVTAVHVYSGGGANAAAENGVYGNSRVGTISHKKVQTNLEQYSVEVASSGGSGSPSFPNNMFQGQQPQHNAGFALSVEYEQSAAAECVAGTTFYAAAAAGNDAYALVAPVDRALMTVSLFAREALPGFGEYGCGTVGLATFPADVTMDSCRDKDRFPTEGGLGYLLTQFETGDKKYRGVHLRCGNSSDKRQRECRAQLTYRPLRPRDHSDIRRAARVHRR
jgi:hypothetical protein